MSVRTNAMTLFVSWAEKAADAVTKRGLGDEFDSAVKALSKEMSKATPEELTVAFDRIMIEMEASVKERLVEHFKDEGVTLSKVFPAFRQYKSDYRGLIMLIGVDVAGFNGPYAVKKEKARILAEKKSGNKGPANDDNGGGNDTPPPAAPAIAATNLTPEVQAKLSNALKAIAKMDEALALEVVSNFEGAAWARLKKANKMLRAVA